MICYLCRKEMHIRFFCRKERCFKSCNLCSKKMSKKRKHKQIANIVETHCPVRDVSELIATMSIEMKESNLIHEKIRYEIRERFRFGITHIINFQRDEVILLDLLSNFLPFPPEIVSMFLDQFRKLVFTYVKIRCMTTHVQCRKHIRDRIFNPPRDTNDNITLFARLLFEELNFNQKQKKSLLI